MAKEARVTLENAYWKGNDIYTNVEGIPYLVDTGAEVSMTRRSLTEIGYLTVQLATGTIEKIGYGIWKNIIWTLGPNNLITVADLNELNQPHGRRSCVKKKLEILRSRLQS